MTSPSSPARMGLVKPNARMLPAISATCAALWVRALRGEGISRPSGQYCSRGRAGESPPGAMACASIISPGSYPPPPTLNFAAIFQAVGRVQAHVVDFVSTAPGQPHVPPGPAEKKDLANSLMKKTDLPTGPRSADPRLLTTPGGRRHRKNNSPLSAARSRAAGRRPVQVVEIAWRRPEALTSRPFEFLISRKVFKRFAPGKKICA